MKVLFLHKNFPAQFRHLAAQLAAKPENEVVFGSLKTAGELPGVRRAFFEPQDVQHKDPHPFCINLQNAVTTAQGVYAMAEGLKAEGFTPDLVYAHAGWGPGLYVKDVWPDTKLLMYFEWLYSPDGPDHEEPHGTERSESDRRRLRTRNAAILLEHHACDWGVSPTKFQASQFPAYMRERITVHHDGVDTRFFRPLAARPSLADLGIEVPPGAPIITYATRGMEPYRGFPQAMRAIKTALARRPEAHAVVLGQDRIAYGRQLPKGDSWKKRMLEELDLDADIKAGRLHFPGLLPYPRYLRVLQASSVHIYLTVPFVLSWSLLESMAAGCLVVSSRTPPVEEVITDGVSGLLADLNDDEEIAAKVLKALDRQSELAELRQAARATIVGRYALADLLPRHIELMRMVMEGRPVRDSLGFLG